MLLVKAPLGPLELAFERFQASVRPQAPPVQLGPHQSHPIVVLAYVCLELYLAAQAHRSNSSTAYAVEPRVSRTPFLVPSPSRQTMNGCRDPMSKIAITVPPRNGSRRPTSVMQS